MKVLKLIFCFGILLLTTTQCTENNYYNTYNNQNSSDVEGLIQLYLNPKRRPTQILMTEE